MFKPSIKSAPADSSPTVEVEVWDESGGVTLQFLGRREISGLDVGSHLKAEGMVGENNGQLIILNPSYEIIAVNPSLTSSPVTEIFSFFKMLLSTTYLFIVLVNAFLKPTKCVPPSFCGMLFVKVTICS